MSTERLISKRVGELLREKRLYLVTAESCSGGLLAHLITSVPGASDYFLGGVIAYSQSAKQLWLEVRADTLRQYGAVSRETVIEMALGVRSAMRMRVAMRRIIGLAISGVAGPGGGTSEKPVGLVWISISSSDGEMARDYHFNGNREEIMRQSAIAALKMLENQLSNLYNASLI